MNVETKKKFTVGSRCFFESFSDFKSKDLDELLIMDRPLFNKSKSFLMRVRDGRDIILYPPFSKEEFIRHDTVGNDRMKFGKYLCPEFAEYIGLTIEDLKSIGDKLLKLLDEKHLYQKVIYESYVANNGFTLTEEQLNKAYAEYKKYRK